MSVTGPTEPSLWTRAPVLPKPPDGCPRTHSHGYTLAWNIAVQFSTSVRFMMYDSNLQYSQARSCTRRKRFSKKMLSHC
jgi:hypothetical protein